MLLFDILYLVVLVPAFPFWIRTLFKKDYRDILRHRLAPDIEPSKAKRIWIHAVSVGEVMSLKTLIARLRDTYDREIVLSVTTPAGFSAAQKAYPDIRVINSPLDFSFAVKAFLKKINPAILVLNELEMWPNWTLLAHRAGIPMVLVNGRISETAFKRYKLFRLFLAGFFRLIDRFLLQAELYKKRFLQLGIPAQKMRVCGNIKADTAVRTAAVLPRDEEIFERLKIDPTANGKKILTLASTHASDEKIVVPVLNPIMERYGVILVPRHLDRVGEIEAALARRGIPYRRWSRGETVNLDRELLIFDDMGYLFNIMKISRGVFMGGTYERKLGGHNLYEPAVLGKPVVGGGCYNNFPDMGHELVRSGVYRVCEDERALVEALVEIADKDLTEIARRATAAVEQRRGSVACILEEIDKFIT